jgi:hypothetical protein
MKAVKDTGNRIVAAVDRSDSVGILDSYFFDVAFFTEFERFDRHVEKLRRLGEDRRIHYTSICSPNYIHDAHVRFSLRIGADAICEKPLVLNPWNLDALAELERESGKRVFNILQLRVHPSIAALREKIRLDPREKALDRPHVRHVPGEQELASWKWDVTVGRIATNIVLHTSSTCSCGSSRRPPPGGASLRSRPEGGFPELEEGESAGSFRWTGATLPREAGSREDHVPLHPGRRGGVRVFRGLHRPSTRLSTGRRWRFGASVSRTYARRSTWSTAAARDGGADRGVAGPPPLFWKGDDPNFS